MYPLKTINSDDQAAPSLPAPRSPRDYFATSDDESTRYSFDSEASSSRQASRGKAPVHDQWRDNNEMATTNHDHHASETTEEEITEAPKSRPYFMHGRQIGGPDRKPRNLIKPPRPSYSTGTQAPVVGFFGWYSKPSRSKI